VTCNRALQHVTNPTLSLFQLKWRMSLCRRSKPSSVYQRSSPCQNNRTWAPAKQRTNGKSINSNSFLGSGLCKTCHVENLSSSFRRTLMWLIKACNADVADVAAAVLQCARVPPDKAHELESRTNVWPHSILLFLLLLLERYGAHSFRIV
jgi:hypothetical protein